MEIERSQRRKSKLMTNGEESTTEKIERVKKRKIKKIKEAIAEDRLEDMDLEQTEEATIGKPE
jgi:hypothetical protein